MKKHAVLTITALLFGLGTPIALASSAQAAIAPLTMHPAAVPFSSGFRLPPLPFEVTDTLVLEAWVVNRGTVPATGLYFTVHLPAGLSMIGAPAELGKNPVFGERLTAGLVDSCRPAHVVFDDPAGSPDLALAPGDSLHVRMYLRAAQAGAYAIPVIAAGFMAGAQPCFALNDQWPVVETAVGAGCCLVRGDVDGGGGVAIADLTYLIALLFRNGAPPPCPEEGDVDGQSGNGALTTISDLAYLVAYLFKSGPPPPPCR